MRASPRREKRPVPPKNRTTNQKAIGKQPPAAAFSTPAVLKAARRVAAMEVCDHCLGRQFAQVSTGMTNLERGRLLRGLLRGKEPKRCTVCGEVFTRLDAYAAEAKEKAAGIEFSTFVVGTVLNADLASREEDLWEEVGIDSCEPLKSEINRELGKKIGALLGKDYDPVADVTFTLDLAAGQVRLAVRSLFIAGSYQKLVRGIPQTKWSTYAVTVEDIVAKPLMKASLAEGHAFHGMGREDIDARCLDWRPFVFELERPSARSLDLVSLEKQVNRSKKVQVRGFRFTDKEEVRRLKALRPDKSYRVLVEFTRPVQQKDLAALKTLRGIINQQTPSRVLHRRADLLRKRAVKEIAGKAVGSRRAVIEVRGQAGLYVKELVTGDQGRTRPSVAELFGPVTVKELDVIKIHVKGYGPSKQRK
ncbi:MAG: tRNA pseudouridine(54/55) synthase Pus10 [Candidatus Aenigmarchaeota archaeon]|nr:tRNA pseudouridine(54/55) synthase Pus10 [Candidatus Aenigmarchaeota archaeon]